MSKKILCNIFVLFFVMFSTAYAAKIDILHYDGADHRYTGPEVTLTLNQKEFEVTEDLMPPIILENRTLVPVREVFETLGGKVEWDAEERRVDIELGVKKISLWIDKQEAVVDSETIEVDVPAKIINSKTIVPARFISEQGGLQVDWNQDTKTVSIDTPLTTIKKVEYMTIEGVKCAVITADSVIYAYRYTMLENDGYHLFLDIENSEFGLDTVSREIEDTLVSKIRFGRHENQKNRVVLDLKEDTDYIVVPSQDRTKLYFALASEFMIPGEESVNEDSEDNVNDNQSNPEKEEPKKEDSEQSGNQIETDNSSNKDNENAETSGEKEENNSSNENIESSGEKEGNNSLNENIENSGEKEEINSSTEKEEDAENNNSSDDDNSQNIIVPDVLITSIKYSTISKRIKIGYEGDIEYKHEFYTNPNRIVIDIQNAELKTEGPKEINPKGSVVTGIRFSQYNDNEVRVVLDLSEKVDYKIYKRTSELQVAVTQPTYRNVSYKLNAANAQLTLMNVDIDDLKGTKSTTADKYTIKYASSNFDSGEGELELEDDFVDKITIASSKIVIYDTGNMIYTMRQSGSNVVVTIKPEEDEPEITDKKVILIDAGHGGSDPGACNGSAQEKVFNLNIALMLNDLLMERNDVEIYMSRDDDTYLNREDRLEIATEVNPDLIVSVHNNSLENKSYTGTMVLYYNNDTESQYGDITSKECAQIVLEKLIDALDTVNRGVVNRQDLHILSKTPCPSILCEISFISNDAELERLKTKEFQENAAQAIYDGVAEILEIM